VPTTPPRMRAAVMHAFAEPLTVEQVRDPDVPGDGVVIEVRATGLCRSDWHVWMGHDPAIRLPHVRDHELAGVVAAVGAQVRSLRTGDRVTSRSAAAAGAASRAVKATRRSATSITSPASAHRAHSPSWWRFPLPTSTASACPTAWTSTRRRRRGAAS
jgi:threonine dehydrogenase-like Zn-dependent dehydrogenase